MHSTGKLINGFKDCIYVYNYLFMYLCMHVSNLHGQISTQDTLKRESIGKLRGHIFLSLYGITDPEGPIKTTQSNLLFSS